MPELAPGERNFETLLEIDMDVATFAADWTHCDRISSYIAHMVSHDRQDSLLYSNLFSSALNELLETTFRIHAFSGRFICTVARSADVDRIQLRVPCDGAARKFYTDAVGEVGRPDIADHYRKSLLSPGPLSPFIGLLELAVDYAARISVEAAGSDCISLTTDLALEGTESQ